MMRRLLPVLVMVLLTGVAHAQTPTGTIAGLVLDPSGAAVAGAAVTIASLETGLVRTHVTADGGRYAAPLLAPGRYAVAANSRGLRSPDQPALVRTGLTTTLDLVLELDPMSEAVTVQPLGRLRHDHHQVSGWIDRTGIERQPLNGRNVLELAKLEPGVGSPERLPGGRVFIAPLGAGLQTIPRIGFTRVTLDGASFETPGTVGSLLQISPDAVDQMHVSTVNFDVSTGLATGGAVNVITRSGGNSFHGGAFSLYRDRQWSAYPVEPFGSTPTDPSFRRHQAGGTLGGPLRVNRAFYFAGYERHDQRDLLSVVPADPELRPLGGAFVSPYTGTLINGRVDVQVTSGHRVFVRHTHDVNRAFTTSAGPLVLPSGWSHRPVRAHQTMVAATGVLASTIVNDLRVSYYAVRTGQEPAGAACPLPCAGLGAPRIVLSEGGPGVLTLGTSPTQALAGRRLQVSDALAWQRGPHLVRVGFDWEHTSHSLFSLDSDPVQMTLWTPGAVRQRDPSIALPPSLGTVDDILQLPLRSFTTSVGSGDVLQQGFRPTRRYHMVRLHAGDQWSAAPRLSVNAGLAWAFEPGVLNHDLAKPDWLAPLVGAGRLRVPSSHHSLSGTIGFAWRATADGRTVIRGGAGRYFESIARTMTLNLGRERVLLSPLGTGRLVVSGSNVFLDGRRLNFPQPTAFTGADLLAALPAIRSSLAGSLNPENRDFSILNLDRAKEGSNLYDPSYRTPRAVHASVGVERAIGGLIVSADLAWKRFSHTFINGIDYNRFFSAQGPLIPACTAVQRSDVGAICSNGSLFFDTTGGRARYVGLLVRVDTHVGDRVRLLASYALGSFVGSNGTGAGTFEASGGRVFGFNNDDWFENYGPLPTDIRHVLNVSGFVVMPWNLQASLNLSAYGRAPFSAYVAGMDFNGDGTMNDLLPGTRVNQFNRGLTREDLVRLVAAYNETYAGKLTAGGQRAPVVTLPGEFSFNDHFFTLDLRLTRVFGVGGARSLSVFVDVFNAFNTMNLTGYSGNLAAPEAFGQPLARVGQAFGSGGPRSAQVGVRVGF